MTAAVLTFRLPRSAYLAVLFLLFCAAPIAFSADGGNEGGPAGLTWRVVFLLVPALAAVFIARTATVVSPDGLRIRAAFGSRSIRWGAVRGLSVNGNSIYVVLLDGSVRLPCVRVSDLAELSRASGGRLPELPDPVAKYAPSRRRR